MASLTYVCFVPAKRLIRGLSANSSNIVFEVPLASKYDGCNLALYHIRIPNYVICHLTTKSVRMLQWLAYLHSYKSLSEEDLIGKLLSYSVLTCWDLILISIDF